MAAPAKHHAGIGDAVIFIVKSLLISAGFVLLLAGAGIWWWLGNQPYSQRPGQAVGSTMLSNRRRGGAGCCRLARRSIRQVA
jgi:hypothetical protein